MLQLNNLISRVSRKVSHYGEVAYCRVERRLIHAVDRARLRAVQEAFIPLLESFEIKYAVCALFSWSNEVFPVFLLSFLPLVAPHIE